MEEKVKQKGSLIKIIIIAAVFCFFVGTLAAVFIFVNSGFETNKLKKQLELGEKYLNEMDYDNAILAYEKALEIDSKTLESYKGIIEAYSRKGDERNAEYWAEKGFAETNDQTLLREKETKQDTEETDIENHIEEEKTHLERVDFEDGSGYNEWEFDSLGNLIRVTYYLYDGPTTDILYDIQNNKRDEIKCFEDGKLKNYVIVEYKDEKKDLFTEYDSEGNILYTQKYVYDQMGEMIIGPLTNPSGSSYEGWFEVVEQNPNGTKKKVIWYDKNNQQYNVRIYDEYGNYLKDEEVISE